MLSTESERERGNDSALSFIEKSCSGVQRGARRHLHFCAARRKKQNTVGRPADGQERNGAAAAVIHAPRNMQSREILLMHIYPT